jgi:hypothetical protein
MVKVLRADNTFNGKLMKNTAGGKDKIVPVLD